MGIRRGDGGEVCDCMVGAGFGGSGVGNKVTAQQTGRDSRGNVYVGLRRGECGRRHGDK